MAEISSSVNQKAGSTGKIWWHLAALFIMTVWGASFVSTKVLLENGLNAVEIFVYRGILAYFLLLIVCHKRIKSNGWRDEFLLAISGLLGITIYFIAENTAIDYTLVGNVSLITSMSPLVTALLLGLFYKNHRPGLEVYIGSLLAIMGVGCIIFQNGIKFQISAVGDLLALSAAFAWALYGLIIARLNISYDALFITRKIFFYGVLFGLPFLIFEPTCGGLTALKKPEVLGNLLFLGIIASTICFLLWTRALKELGTVTASNYNYLQPISTLVIAYFILNEAISMTGYFGCVLIMTGLVVSDKLTVKPRVRT